ncbi:NAD-glutamate dehydrogenase [Endozoicomonas sp. SESOKO1]|uniref:NAD-glutamate dehydrogenase n=1 Tax=Endozoicomonas sp. SESOKO1 TaxID=2828742 RepID=UPI00214750F3|nr:NAD-glutamate dehydrogenase [Endozoicomonas sp. SESOKO1]
MNRFTDFRAVIVNQVQSLLAKRMSNKEYEQIQALADAYYRGVASKDLIRINTDDGYGALLCLWQFLQKRRPGQIKIRAYNPEPETHHWHSTHSIIEIITDDMPFLVSSVLMELDRQKIKVYSLNHPTLRSERDSAGQLNAISTRQAKINEAVIRVEIDRQPERLDLEKVASGIRGIVEDVHKVVSDWEAMQTRLDDAIQWCQTHSVPLRDVELKEALAFLNWLKKENFLFIGFRYYEIIQKPNKLTLRTNSKTGLGTFREGPEHHPVEQELSPYIASQIQAPELLVITKSISRSTVHRPAHLDYIGIKQFNDSGAVIGEWRFFGLFSSTAYNVPLDDIPLIRKKVAELLKNNSCPINSHRGNALRHIIHNYPRDELLQASFEQLKTVINGILDCHELRQLRVFLRPDTYDRFITVLVYVSRDNFNTELRLQMQQILLSELSGNSIDVNVQLSENPMAQLQFTVHCRHASQQNIDVERLEAMIHEAMLSWTDHLQQALKEALGEASGNRMAQYYLQAFPAAYREDATPRQAVADIRRLESLKDSHQIRTSLYRPVTDHYRWHFRVLGKGPLLALSDVLPILEKMGVRVHSARPYAISPCQQESAWVLDFSIEPAGHDNALTANINSPDVDSSTSNHANLEDTRLREQFREVFIRTWKGEMENDGFNGLVVSASLNWEQIVLIRALSKYLMQLQVPFSQSYMQKVLNSNPAVIREIVDLFSIRFDPDFQGDRHEMANACSERIYQLLDSVTNLDEDRILRHFLSVIEAMLRTSAYQKQGEPKGYLSFKLQPDKIPTSPHPRPMFEIFVYSPRFEGIHMRCGKIARGGLRWSDRMEDFRTEILGLVKAQMIKNAIIVPHGAKGGFVTKHLPANGSREEIQAEGVACYRAFISGLLDLTDNLHGGNIIPPDNVIRYDDDDPYLVVAADKGTARFSDIANDVSESYGFWLRDAFASGGSLGYDHKKMGITARGAWESVKRIFKEREIDTQTQDFTVIGIGDMSGDVFGNGMLLSNHIRLIAAFNHQHIFIDPDPDISASFSERQRLFNLLRSSWDDYDRNKLSEGGGVFSRQLKSIHLSKQARTVLATDKTTLSPAELIQTILKAPADLLWNGGIGTYIRASSESNTDAGDRSNDNVRISASELNTSAVGEGGNLGLTQLARIEFSRRGGLINTDAVDNSGGVDSSDHEVNIKILLNQMVDDGDITLKQRNSLLASMTDEVARLVLRHNFLQSQRLSLSLQQNVLLFNDHRFLIRKLEKKGRLNRAQDGLPSDTELKARVKAGEGLTRPEIAILLSHTKLELFESLVSANVGDDPVLAAKLPDYFPSQLRNQFPDQIRNHPLKTEILATHLSNEVGNRMGATFIEYIHQETRHSELNCVRAFMAIKEIFSIPSIWDQFEGLGFDVKDDIQRVELFRVQQHIEKACIWLLKNHGGSMDIESLISNYKPGVSAVSGQLAELLGEEDCAWLGGRVTWLQEAQLPQALAETCAGLRYLYYVLFMVSVANEYQFIVTDVASIFFALEDYLCLPWLRERIRQLPVNDLWQRKAQSSLKDQLDRTLNDNCIHVLTHSQGKPEERLKRWLEKNAGLIDRWKATIREIQSAREQNLAMLSVAIQELSLIAS